MCCRFLALVVVLPLLIAGCNKPQKQVEINSTPPPALDSSTAPASPAPVALVTPKPTPATPAPVALTTSAPTPAIDRTARVMILCYHRFEDRPHDTLAISPAEFRTQMQALKDGGIAVIPMKDFLAWRQGGKEYSASEAASSLSMTVTSPGTASPLCGVPRTSGTSLFESRVRSRSCESPTFGSTTKLQHILPYCSRRVTVAFVYALSQV